jgi:hypothetical protein
MMKKIFFLAFLAGIVFASCKKDQETSSPYKGEVILNGKSYTFNDAKWFFDGELYDNFYSDTSKRFDVYILNKAVGVANFDNYNSVFFSVEHNNYNAVVGKGSINITRADDIISGTFSGRFYINHDTTTVVASGSFYALQTTF